MTSSLPQVQEQQGRPIGRRPVSVRKGSRGTPLTYQPHILLIYQTIADIAYISLLSAPYEPDIMISLDFLRMPSYQPDILQYAPSGCSALTFKRSLVQA